MRRSKIMSCELLGKSWDGQVGVTGSLYPTEIYGIYVCIKGLVVNPTANFMFIRCEDTQLTSTLRELTIQTKVKLKLR